jgi:hypothetical protein
MKPLKFVVRLRDVELIPRGYGVAYYDYTRAQGVAYPIPLNLLIRGYRKLEQWVKVYTPSQRDKDLAAAANKGFQQGLEAGEARAKERMHRSLDAFLQERAR